MVEASKVPALVHALSGAIGGTVANITVFPLDLITTRLQVQNKIKTDKHYASVYDAFVKIYQEGGMGEFYEGVVGDSAATMLQAFLYFFAYDFMRSRRVRQIKRNTGSVPRTLNVAEELSIGSLAGIFCKLFTSPINNIVIRQQTAALNQAKGLPVHEPTPLECAKQIYDEHGITGFWSGYRATLILSFNPSLTYYFFQILSAQIVPRSRRNKPTTFEVFISAALAKTMATIITYPVIVLKTRTQVGAGKDLPLYKQLAATYKQEGASALFDGASGQILKSFFNQGITMMTKDKITRFVVLSYLYFRAKPRRA